MKLTCICAKGQNDKLWATVNGVDILECLHCGVRRVSEITEKYSEMYTSGEYHQKGSSDLTHEAAGREPHASRLAQDTEVAEKRLTRLSQILDLSSKALLDVGCANGAFMLVASKTYGCDVEGVDLHSDAIEASLKDKIRVGDIRHVGLQRRSKDIVTFNDSFEHFVDPMSALMAAKGILKRDGLLVIDIPDMGSKMALEKGTDFHHVKPHEHLWYFTAQQLRNLLETSGLYVVKMEVPVEGKITIYATPEATVQEINVYGPPGIGDILWTLPKLKPIRDREYPCRIVYNVCVEGQTKMARRAEDFCNLCEWIDEVRFVELPCPFTDRGCADPSKAEYELVANGWVDTKKPPFKAKHLRDWHPELGTSWDVGIHIPEAAMAQAKMRLGSTRYVAIYMSSVVYNSIVCGSDWSPKDWIRLMQSIKDNRMKAVILGAEWDRDFLQVVSNECVAQGIKPSDLFLDLTGRTPLALAMAFMKQSVATIGLAAGLPILGAQLGIPTVILWPVHGVSSGKVCENIEHGWNEGFATSWVPDTMNREFVTYQHAIFGRDDFDSIISKLGQVTLAGLRAKHAIKT